MAVDQRSLIEFLRDANRPLEQRVSHALQYRGELGAAFEQEAERLLKETENLNAKAAELRRACGDTRNGNAG